MFRYIPILAIAVCAAANAQERRPVRIAQDIPRPVRIAELEPRGANAESELLKAIQTLSYKIDMLQVPAPVAVPIAAPMAAPAAAPCCAEPAMRSSCCDAMDGYSVAPQYQTQRVAIRRPIVMVEPPMIIDATRSNCIVASGTRTVRSSRSCLAREQQVMMTMQGNTCDSQMIEADVAYTWRTSLCDMLRGRSRRQVGPYTVDVQHRLFDTEVTVLP